MKKIYYLLVSTLLIASCSKPTAEFLINADDNQAPALINFKNLSKNSESYIWSINEDVVSEDETLEHLFLESGRYDIQLKALKDGKIASQTKPVFIDAPKNCSVYIETSLGAMTFVLSELTPNHRDNFLDLIEKKYYNGLSFHRVIDGFMIQGGDNKTRKTKDRFKFKEQIPSEFNKEHFHYKGALAAARMPDDINPDKMSSGTQFYIVDGVELSIDAIKNHEASKLFSYTVDQKKRYLESGGAPQLDGEYTVFGYLIDGFDVLEKISKIETGEMNVPLKEVLILDIKAIN